MDVVYEIEVLKVRKKLISELELYEGEPIR